MKDLLRRTPAISVAGAGARASSGAALLPSLVLLLLAGTPAPAAAQEMDHGMHHGMHGDSTGWRMPPMDPSMPMLPGLGAALPPVGALLPGSGMVPSMFPAARPSETVAMEHMDTLDVSVSLVRRELDGKTYVMYGYNQQYPGPLITAEQGSTVVVRLTNDIQLPTTIHWHGIRLENRFDGVPGVTQDPVEQGESFTYEVYVPDTGLYWYHPHVREDVQQDLGLYGNLLVEPAGEEELGPVHAEEMLVVDDLLVDDQGMIPYGDTAATHALMGRFGTMMLVNGRTDERFEVDRGGVLRFYVTNVANARTFNVTFGEEGQARAKVVASDLSRYEREQWVPSLIISPAERYTVDVRFDEPGTVAITNRIQAVNHFRGEFYPHVDTLALVEVSDEAAPPLAEPFDELRTYDEVTADIERYREHFDRPVDHELVTTVEVKNLPVPIMLSMEADSLYVPPMEWNDAMPMMNWLSTGTQVTWMLEEAATGRRNAEIDWTFRTGDVVKIRVRNTPDSFHPMNHPIHIHGQRFLVLERDGVPQENLVWKDTAIIPVGSTMDLLVEMTNPGAWMLHCHIAEHLEAGMMFNFTVEGESLVPGMR